MEPDWKGQGEAASAELVVLGLVSLDANMNKNMLFVECYPDRPYSR